MIITIATLVVAMSLRITGTYSTLWQAIKDSLCQVISFISTSGYYVCDYSNWPTFSVTLLFLLLFIGGCSFSTSGSLKIIRVTFIFKLIKRGILKQIHPNIVKAVKLNDETVVSAKSASVVTMHTLLYFVVIVIGTLLLSFNNLDMETTFTTTVGIFSNTGISLIKALHFERRYPEEFSKRLRIGTIHTFQGSECDVIIYDMVDCGILENGRTSQIGKIYGGRDGERLLNVAVSRAKHKLIVVCDPTYISNISGNTLTPKTRQVFNLLSKKRF